MEERSTLPRGITSERTENYYGFAIIVTTDAITNCGQVKPGSWPEGRKLTNILEKIEMNANALSSTTRAGKNHPCQTENYRCDHQGSYADGAAYCNTQMQLGGEKQYKRGKVGTALESTSVSEVHIDSACFGRPGFELAARRAHELSTTRKKVVILKLGEGQMAVGPAEPRHHFCGHCRYDMGAVGMPTSLFGVKLCPNCGEDYASNFSYVPPSVFDS